MSNIKMNNILLLWICLILATACASRVAIDPKGCAGYGVWHKFATRDFEYANLYQELSLPELKEKYDFVVVKNVKTPLGLLKEERVYVKAILEASDIKCYEVETLAMSYHNKVKDVILSFVPLLGSKTVILYGNFWQKKSVAPENYSKESINPAKNFDL